MGHSVTHADSNQPFLNSFLSWKLPPSPCAVLLVFGNGNQPDSSARLAPYSGYHSERCTQTRKSLQSSLGDPKHHVNTMQNGLSYWKRFIQELARLTSLKAVWVSICTGTTRATISRSFWTTTGNVILSRRLDAMHMLHVAMWYQKKLVQTRPKGRATRSTKRLNMLINYQ